VVVTVAGDSKTAVTVVPAVAVVLREALHQLLAELQHQVRATMAVAATHLTAVEVVVVPEQPVEVLQQVVPVVMVWLLVFQEHLSHTPAVVAEQDGKAELQT
jgi:uncharacterized membrane protein (DUF4010 family)